MKTKTPTKVHDRRPGLALTGVAGAIAFAVLYMLTVVESTVDTPVYVSQILDYHQKGSAASPLLLWEFGHLLWRPIGYFLWRVMGPALSSWSGNNPSIEITAILLGINFFVGAALTILLLFVCKRLGLAKGAAVAITAGFMLFSTVLRHVHSGTSYNLGFMLQLSALLLILRAIQMPRRREGFAVLGGAALALSFAVWFPYILGVPSILLAGWCIKPTDQASEPNTPQRRLRLVIVAGFAAAILGAVLFAGGALKSHLHSYEALKQWVVNSAHGVAPENRIVRLPTGVTRSFLYFGDQGVILKRFVLGDPYAPVHVADLFPALWKVVFVFLVFGLVLIALARNRRGWPALAILLCGFVPTVAFAVLLFETSGPERYEPAYPAILVAVCALLVLPEGRTLNRGFLAVFLAVLAAVNLFGFGWTLRSTNSKVAARAILAHDHAVPRGIVFLLSFRDPLSTFVQRSPFSPLNRQGALPFYHAIEPGNARMDTWRHDAACRIFQAWSDGGEAWLSDRLTANRPEPEWEWVERDDRRVHWSDVSGFFNRFEKDNHIGEDDGFFRVPGDPKNLEEVRHSCPESAVR